MPLAHCIFEAGGVDGMKGGGTGPCAWALAMPSVATYIQAAQSGHQCVQKNDAVASIRVCARLIITRNAQLSAASTNGFETHAALIKHSPRWSMRMLRPHWLELVRSGQDVASRQCGM
eukprot:jgi/Ulvmu1/5564/UM023_0101.1